MVLPRGVALVILLAGATALCGFALTGRSERAVARAAAPASDAPGWIELEVRGIVPLEDEQGYAVLLVTRDRDFLVPVLVDAESGWALSLHLAERPVPPPWSVALLQRLLAALDGVLLEVQLTGLQEDRVVCRMLLRVGKRLVALDTTSSEALPLAVLEGARLFVAHPLLGSVGLTRKELEDFLESVGEFGDPPDLPEAPGPPTL